MSYYTIDTNDIPDIEEELWDEASDWLLKLADLADSSTIRFTKTII